MDIDQVLLSDELLAVMRTAVSYAVEFGGKYIGPAHLLVALMDDPKVGDPLRDILERGRLVAAARQPVTAGINEAREGPLPRGEKVPFTRYDTLVFQSSDGYAQRWANRATYRIFNEAAKRVESGRFLPRHLLLGVSIDALEDRETRNLLGRDPELFKEFAFSLS